MLKTILFIFLVLSHLIMDYMNYINDSLYLQFKIKLNKKVKLFASLDITVGNLMFLL